MASSPWKRLLALACLVTLLNAIKPLTIDDTAYYYYARQMADRPLDPYGFAFLWWDRPYVANEVLAPPVLPYWWSLGIRLFGESPVLWKLWLLPFSVLFVGSLWALFHRFCRGLALPLTVLTVLSPTFLPGFNLMLDVPAVALGLTALALFFRAGDRNAFGLAALSGLLAGLAMQTKYTAFLVPVVMLLYTVVFGKWRLWPAAAVLAVQVFVSWELIMALLYGESHFLGRSREHENSFQHMTTLAVPLLTILGAIVPGVFLLGLAALRLPRWVVALAGALVLAGYAVTACLGTSASIDNLLPLPQNSLDLSPAVCSFTTLGSLTALTLVAVMVCLCRLPSFDVPWSRRLRRLRPVLFLIGWLLLEVAGYFALSPFAAARRLMGVVIVATLLTGRLASRTCRSPARVRLVWVVIAFGLLLGLGFAALDDLEAWTEKRMVEEAAALAREHGGGTIWFTGHWGFQFYGEQSGMRPVLTRYTPEESHIPLPEPSRLHKGDWLVVPSERVYQQKLWLDPVRTEPKFWLAMTDPIPLRTVMCYYCGDTALAHRETPNRLEVVIYRVTEDFVPRREK